MGLNRSYEVQKITGFFEPINPNFSVSRKHTFYWKFTFPISPHVHWSVGPPVCHEFLSEHLLVIMVYLPKILQHSLYCLKRKFIDFWGGEGLIFLPLI